MQPAQTLTLSRAGAGGGRVVSTPAGIACTTACGANFPLGSTVSLTATAVQNAVFAGWTGRCSGVSTCTVRMYGARTVGAEFIVLPSVLSMTIESRYWDGATFLSKTGAGAMAFFDNLPKNVPGYTNEPIPVTTLVRNAELFAPPTVGASLSLASRYVVHLSAVGATPITFRFSGDMSDGGAMLLDGVEIALNWSGSGSGPLLEATAPLVNGEHTIQVVGFEKCCDGATPLFEYNVGTGWIAVIAPPPPPTPLIVSVLTPGGVPGGRITSAPAGIDCGPSCQSLFPTGSQVTLSATPNQYFAFTGWGGSCTGTTACVVRMLEPGRSVTSGFVRVAYPVTVSMTGTGTGSVALSPSGGTCGSGCWTYSPGTSLTLTATPDANSLFGGWSVPGCTGTTCTLTVNADLTVSARFDRKMAVVTGVPSGSGSGTVTSSPAGINCGTICAASFAEGSTVKLAAQPAPGSSFDGWSGACTGTGPCSVTAAAGVVVTPTFSRLADTTPPTLSCVATPKELWPVNHKMVDIRVAVSLADAGSGPAGFTLLSVTSNEPDGSSESPDGRDDDKEKKGDDDKEKKGDDDKGSGDGKSLVDILGWNIGTADVTGQLRAERAGNRTDRVYTLTYRGLDVAGNATVASCTVTVPHDKR